MTLKERIKSLADAEGISLPVLESKLGFGNSTIVKWDKSTPNAEKLNKVAQYFNVTMDYLLNGGSCDDDSVLNNIDKKVMTTYDVISDLCKKRNLAITALERELGFGRGSIGKLRTGNTTLERLQKIADYFGVSVNYLTTGKEDTQIKLSSSELTSRDKRDITKDLESIMAKLSNKEDGPVSYNGENLSEESMDLFKEELEIALKRLKLINKEKYNPNKNKK